MWFKKNKKGECVYTTPLYRLTITYNYTAGYDVTKYIESENKEELITAKDNTEKDLQKEDKLKFLVIRTKESSVFIMIYKV